ncbi:glycosyltransferase family 2 protein [Cribrihabitans sp. XS_ASV171]
MTGAAPDLIGPWDAYRLRWKRRRLLWRSFRSRHALTCLVDRTQAIRPGAILAFTPLRNEAARLPFFLDHYRRLGVDHFLIVDNGSEDGSVELLQAQEDVSLWQTRASYRGSRFALDWLTWLQMRHGHGHWTLMVDADELLVYPHHGTRPLPELVQWLDARGQEAFGTLMLDLYPQGPLGAQQYVPGTDPVEVIGWFDPGPYRVTRQQPLGNLWVQGGVRERVFFSEEPRRSPTLNKIPLVRWDRRYAYVNSCHSALPRRLNYLYDGPGGETPSGVLLHTKFLPEVVEKSGVEKVRAQHFHAPELFDHYYDRIAGGPVLWNENSHRYEGWRQLAEIGLLNTGGW